MFEKITSSPKKVVAHVKNCRGRYAAATGFITGALLMHTIENAALAHATDFLEEKGLTDEFFNKNAEI